MTREKVVILHFKLKTVLFTRSSNLNILKESSIILIDKPLNWTSFDAVKKLKYAVSKKFGLKQRKFKIGHAGTLDPLATGLLIMCTGKATKLIQGIQDAPKVYTGSLMLGATTPSYDLETEVDKKFDYQNISAEDCEAATAQFIGEIDQTPPIYSAIWVNGKRAYDLARKGIDVVLKSRKVTITEFKVGVNSLPLVDFEVACSKGTYIRSLAHNYGAALNNGAYLNSLRRTAIGDYQVSDAWAVEDFIEFVQNHELDEGL
jgi:tRNA pseudouridine55 synthase